MQVRGAKFSADGTIDCEVEHPLLGWVPYTADQTDPEPFGRAVYAAAAPVAAPFVAGDPAEAAAAALAAERADMVVSRFQARAALLEAGLLDAVEAAVAASSPMVQLAWAEAIEWRRLSPTIVALGAAVGLSETQLDDLFRAAAAIEV